MVDGWLGALETRPAIEALRLSSWAYPAVNTLHVVGIALLFGAIVPLDLRLLGWRRDDATLRALSAVLLPVAMAGFALAALAGLLLFATDARAYAASPFFRAKLVFIACALANAWQLRTISWRDSAVRTRRLALTGTASILLWLGALVLGRWIAYA
jgi:hypothetical protein